jgi:hypothetical protein
VTRIAHAGILFTSRTTGTTLRRACGGTIHLQICRKTLTISTSLPVEEGAAMLASSCILIAQQPTAPVTAPTLFDPVAFGMSVLATIIFCVVGIALAIMGFKLFDMLTPGKLEVEIVEKQNIAAAILGAAIIIGICYIVAQAMH